MWNFAAAPNFPIIPPRSWHFGRGASAVWALHSTRWSAIQRRHTHDLYAVLMLNSKWLQNTILIGNNTHYGTVVITFRVSRRRREMYCGHLRLCVCLSVRGGMPTLARTWV